ncbi:MAG: gamma-glutamylcyclotransferase family protein [Pseudomonadota bacterium]
MTQRLFVYGTLAPGRPNEHVMKHMNGTWRSATVKGHLRREGWGADLGYPGIELTESGDDVVGHLFESEELSRFLRELDEFEGAEYQRVLTTVFLPNGDVVDAWIYRLRPD